MTKSCMPVEKSVNFTVQHIDFKLHSIPNCLYTNYHTTGIGQETKNIPHLWRRIIYKDHGLVHIFTTVSNYRSQDNGISLILSTVQNHKNFRSFSLQLFYVLSTFLSLIMLSKLFYIT